jgi:hypothetical protein
MGRIAYLKKLLSDLDFIFDPATEAESERQRLGVAALSVAQYLARVDSKHAERFRELAQAMGDLDRGGQPPILRASASHAHPNLTMVECAKADAALALEACVQCGDNVLSAARNIMQKYPAIKNLGTSKSVNAGSWATTLVGWRKTYSASSKVKNSDAQDQFFIGREAIERLSALGLKDDLRKLSHSCAQRACELGVKHLSSLAL